MKKIKGIMNKPVYLGLSKLKISKTLMYDFGMITLNQSIRTMQNYAARIQTVLSLTLKQKMSIKILLMMLKKDFIHQTMKSIDHYLKEGIKKLLD